MLAPAVGDTRGAGYTNVTQITPSNQDLRKKINFGNQIS